MIKPTKSPLDSVKEAIAAIGDGTATAQRIKSLASRGLRNPHDLTQAEVQELAGSVMRHIERHGPLKS